MADSDNSQKNKSVGLIIVTHGDYGSGLLRAAEFITGAIQDCVSIAVDANFIAEESVARLKEAATRLNTGGGVLILTDMFGGTPTNVSLALMNESTDIDVITGVNLPMLLRVLSNRNLPLAKVSELAYEAGLEGIVAAGQILRTKASAK